MTDNGIDDRDDEASGGKKPGTALVPFQAASTALVPVDEPAAPESTALVLHRPKARQLYGTVIPNEEDLDEAAEAKRERAAFTRAAKNESDDDAPRKSDTVFSNNLPVPVDPNAQNGANADTGTDAAGKGGARKIKCADGRYIYDYGHEIRTRETKISPAQAAAIAQLSGEKGWSKLYVYRGDGKTMHNAAAAQINAAGGGLFQLIQHPKMAGKIGSHKGEALAAIAFVLKAREIAQKMETPKF